MLNIVTYNCNSFRNNIEVIKQLVSLNDIILLQEIMLLKEDVSLITDLDDGWDGITYVKDRAMHGIIEGRPQKGVAILWKKSLSELITPIYHDDCIIGIYLNTSIGKVLLINVYLPHDNKDLESLENFINYLSIVNTIIDEGNTNQIILAGDFNTHYNRGRYWKILNDFLRELNLFYVDLGLPSESFTYLSPSHNTVSWIDHVFCSMSLRNLVNNFNVNYELCLYDHFPLAFQFNVSCQFVNENNDSSLIGKFVYWNKMSKVDFETYQCELDMQLKCPYLFSDKLINCKMYNCSNKTHLGEIDMLLDKIISIIHLSSSKFSVEKKNVKKCVPGWNDLVKSDFLDAKESFRIWKEGGRPREGVLLLNMRSSRAKFKQALKFCKTQEETIRLEKMTQAFRSRNMNSFWSSFRSIKNNNFTIPSIINNTSDIKQIANTFSDHFQSIFNKDVGINYGLCFESVDHKVALDFFNVQNIINAVQSMNLSIGPDGVHVNHLKYAPYSLFKTLTIFINACVIHNYLPKLITAGVISPLIKDRNGDVHDIKNYRPIISSSVFLKLIEYCILQRIKHYLSYNERQHGFREKHSTSSAYLVLQETILNYTKKGSEVHSCFMDLSKAFDSVNHQILFRKLRCTGIPTLLVNLIICMYKNQNISVKFKSGKSDEWLLSNGVRQGGILSPLFFNIYINDLITNISSSGLGCRLGLKLSNIIVYADDIVILAPSKEVLQELINLTSQEVEKLNLTINLKKTFCMVFNNTRSNGIPSYVLNTHKLTIVHEMKYLGYLICDDLSSKPDVIRVRKSFYNNFNSILRKFNTLDVVVLLSLFRTYCLSFYGAEHWSLGRGCHDIIRQFSVGYHKAIKKIFKVSTHESNHAICEQARLMTFKHYLNYIRIMFALRTMNNPCNCILTNFCYFKYHSHFMNDIKSMARTVYQIEDICNNDKDAIESRISFVQSREERMR